MQLPAEVSRRASLAQVISASLMSCGLKIEEMVR